MNIIAKGGIATTAAAGLAVLAAKSDSNLHQYTEMVYKKRAQVEKDEKIKRAYAIYRR